MFFLNYRIHVVCIIGSDRAPIEQSRVCLSRSIGPRAPPKKQCSIFIEILEVD